MSETTRPLALVTGASSGIGVSYATALARRGFDLVLVARRADRLRSVADDLAKLGATATPLVADLGDPQGIARVADACRERPLELLVNNAGVAHYMPFATLPPERADEIVLVNTMAVVSLSRAAIGGMVERGHGGIINVASLLAFSGAMRRPGLPARAIYAGTKAFMVAFTQVLAAELEATGVKVQVVCPGVVASEFHSAQGIDMSHVPRLMPDDMVRASLADLDAGVVVSIPTLEDLSAFGEIDKAQGQLLATALRPSLASRYGTES